MGDRNPAAKLFIGGLSYNTTKDSLEDAAAKYGRVTVRCASVVTLCLLSQGACTVKP